MRKGRSKQNFYHKHEDEHDDESWLISYADMMTLLFGFFVILYSFSTLDSKKFDQMSEKVAQAFSSNEKNKTSNSGVGVSGEERQLRAMQMLITMLNLGGNMDEAVGNIEKTYSQAQNAGAAKNVLMQKVAEEHRGIVTGVKADDLSHTVELVLPDTSLFASGSYQLSPQGAAKVKTLAGDLQNTPSLLQIEVSGHTDSRLPSKNSTFQNNFALSSLRAGAIAEVLLRAGIEPKKLVVRGMAHLKPILPERDRDGNFLPENMAKNRRVTILLKLGRE